MISGQVSEVGMKALIPDPSANTWKYLFAERSIIFPSDSTRLWDIPGGRVKPGDLDWNQGLDREVFEEIRQHVVLQGPNKPVPFKVQRIPRHQGDGTVQRYTSLARTLGGPVLLSPEHVNYEYLARSEALERSLGQELVELLENEALFAFEEYLEPQVSLAAIRTYVLAHR